MQLQANQELGSPRPTSSSEKGIGRFPRRANLLDPINSNHLHTSSHDNKCMGILIPPE